MKGCETENCGRGPFDYRNYPANAWNLERLFFSFLLFNSRSPPFFSNGCVELKGRCKGNSLGDEEAKLIPWISGISRSYVIHRKFFIFKWVHGNRNKC